MKITLRILSIAIASLSLLAPLSSISVFAAEKESCSCYDINGNKIGDGTKPATAVLGDSACDCGHGESIVGILNLVVDIMTIGVGILGVIGIIIVGIQYLTSAGNEEKTRKAKRRMFEIVIGIAAYVIIYSLLNWLVPGFKPLGG